MLRCPSIPIPLAKLQSPSCLTLWEDYISGSSSSLSIDLILFPPPLPDRKNLNLGAYLHLKVNSRLVRQEFKEK